MSAPLVPAAPRQPAMGSGAPSTVRCQGSKARPGIAPTTSVRIPSAPASTRRRSAGPTEAGSRARAESARPIQARARRALERDVHLLLAVLRVVVPGVAGGIRRGFDRQHAEARQPELGGDLSHRPPKGGLHLLGALTRRACHRVLPFIVVWWCRFAAPSGQLGRGWCNLSKGWSGMCSRPTLVAVFVGTSVSTTSAERSTTTPSPANRCWELLDATGHESCPVVQ